MRATTFLNLIVLANYMPYITSVPLITTRHVRIDGKENVPKFLAAKQDLLSDITVVSTLASRIRLWGSHPSSAMEDKGASGFTFVSKPLPIIEVWNTRPPLATEHKGAASLVRIPPIPSTIEISIPPPVTPSHLDIYQGDNLLDEDLTGNEESTGIDPLIAKILASIAGAFILLTPPLNILCIQKRGQNRRPIADPPHDMEMRPRVSHVSNDAPPDYAEIDYQSVRPTAVSLGNEEPPAHPLTPAIPHPSPTAGTPQDSHHPTVAQGSGEVEAGGSAGLQFAHDVGVALNAALMEYLEIYEAMPQGE